jgi:serine/threonine-protein kinase
LRDRYRVLRALARGGFGATFLAQDATLPGEPSCVIKQLRPLASGPEVLQMARELFAREAKTLGLVGIHPQVPRLLDYFEDDQQFYLVQEYISGLTLQQEVKRSGPFSEAGVKQFLSEILPLLQYIHDQKVIHRDIKPANLIRREQDRKLVLIDFGAVKNQVSAISTSQSEQTALTAYSVGTGGFAPPEQIALRPVYASDIYAVGITCLYLLTGKSPQDIGYNPKTGEMLWQDKVHISDHLASVLGKMLEGSVRHRYQSTTEVLNALDLEPYLDSLANSMAAKSSGGRERSPNRSTPTSSRSSSSLSGGSSASYTAQLAATIRARRANGAETTSNLQGKTTPYGLGKTKQTTATKPNVPRRLDTNGLLTAYAKGRRDFSLHDLSRLDLQQADLQSTNFHSSKLDKTNLQGANLFNSDLNRASLNGANLRKANLSKAYLSYANLEQADLRGADLSYADLNNANLRGANLCGANLTGAKLADEQLALAKMNWMTVRPNGKRGLL